MQNKEAPSERTKADMEKTASECRTPSAENKKKRGHKLCIVLLVLCLACGGTAVLQALHVLPAFSFQSSRSQITQQDYDTYISFDDGLLELETDYLNEDGYVEPQDVQALLQAVEEQAKAGIEDGIVASCSKEEDCVYITYTSGIKTMFIPCREGMLAGGGGGKICTLQPNKSGYNKNIQNVIAWIDGIYNDLPCSSYSVEKCVNLIRDSDPGKFKYQPSLSEFGSVQDPFVESGLFPTGYANQAVTVKTFKNIPDCSVLIWEGHGGYSQVLHSGLVTGQMFVGWAQMSEYAKDMEEDRLVLTSFPRAFASEDGEFSGIPYSPVRYYCITSKFVDTYIGQMDSAPIVFLGSCLSGKDETLANSFLDKGARAVVCFTDVTGVAYEILMRTMFFYALSQNPNTSISQAVEVAKSTIGRVDYTNTTNQSEMVCYSRNNDADVYGLQGKIEQDASTQSQPEKTQEKPDLQAKYLAFRKQDDFEEKTAALACGKAEKYAIFDVDGDGAQELLILSQSDMAGFASYMAFTYDAAKDAVVQIPFEADADAPAGQCYGGLRYSPDYHALVYSAMNNGSRFGSMGYKILRDGQIQQDFALIWEAADENHPGTYTYTLWQNQADRSLTNEEYASYLSALTEIAFEPIPAKATPLPDGVLRLCEENYKYSDGTFFSVLSVRKEDGQFVCWWSEWDGSGSEASVEEAEFVWQEGTCDYQVMGLRSGDPLEVHLSYEGEGKVGIRIVNTLGHAAFAVAPGKADSVFSAVFTLS